MASSITLISAGGGTYDYGVTLAPNEDVIFSQNQTITLSGLSGVFAAVVPSSPLEGLSCFTVESLTSTSAVFAQTQDEVACELNNVGNSSPFTFGDLILFSTVLTVGTINFSMETANEGTITGTTLGPFGSVSEPSSLLLLGSGLLRLASAMRRKLLR